jgi:hypothetical protein
VSDPCTGVQERMIEALLAHRDAAAPDLAHAETCDECRSQRDDFLAMRVGLDEAPWPELPEELAERARVAAFAELAAHAQPAHAPLPQGFGRQLVRVLAAPVLLLPFIVAWNAAVLSFGGELLAGTVPTAVLGTAGVFYALAAGGSVAVLFGSIPFVAQAEARRRLCEVTP